MDEDKDRPDLRFVDQIRTDPGTQAGPQFRAQDRAQFRAQSRAQDRTRDEERATAGRRPRFRDELKAQFKTILRITGLMLCCAVLFVSGFYLGIYQQGLTRMPQGGIITGTYPPSEGGTVTGITSPGGVGTLGSTSADAAEAPATTTATTATTTTTADKSATGATASEDQETATQAPEPSSTPEGLLATLTWPVAGKIVREPGWVFSETLRQWSYYSGVDIACDPGAEVVAALAGSVKKVEVDPALGTLVTVQHGSGLVTTYGRVERVALGPGDEVEQGEAIGASGPGGVYFSITCQDEPVSARECLATAK